VSHRLRPVLLALVLLLPVLLGPLARPVEAVTGVRVVVNCFSNPETARVTNKTAGTITTRTVGSIYQPYSYEPITVNRSLGPGSSSTFQSERAAAGANKLTGNYIYNDSVGTAEGARVTTSLGNSADRCS